MSYCANCGIELNPSEKFCHKCGHENSEAPTSTPSPPISASTPAAPAPIQTKKKLGCLKIALIALVPLVIFIALLIMLALWATKGPAESVDSHIEALKAGAVERAYYQTSTLFQENTSLEEYRQFIEAYPILKNIDAIHVSERLVENNQGAVKGDLSDSTGKRVPILIQLIKEGDNWRILALNLPESEPVAPPTPVSPTPPAPTPASPAPKQPGTAEPSVGTVIIGSGRNPDGTLIKPGKTLSPNAPKLSADIELINHPLGQRVQIWVEHLESGKKTQPVDGEIEGAGSGTITFDLVPPPSGNWPSGKWRLFVLLGEKMQFTSDYSVP